MKNLIIIPLGLCIGIGSAEFFARAYEHHQKRQAYLEECDYVDSMGDINTKYLNGVLQPAEYSCWMSGTVYSGGQ